MMYDFYSMNYVTELGLAYETKISSSYITELNIWFAIKDLPTPVGPISRIVYSGMQTRVLIKAMIIIIKIIRKKLNS